MNLDLRPIRRRLVGGVAIASLFIGAALLTSCRKGPADPVHRIKMAVDEAGIYEVALTELQALGFAADELSHQEVSVTANGEQVPFHVRGDKLVVYGQPSNSRYSAQRTYVISAGDEGLPMETMRDAGALEAVAAISQTLRLEKDLEYVSDAAVGDEAPWFWQTIQIQESIAIPFALSAVGDGSATVQISLYGSTHNPQVEPDHTLSISVNGSESTTIDWDGQVPHLAELTLPTGTLREGENVIVLENLPDDFLDIMRLNWVEISYASAPDVVGNYAHVVSSGGTAELTGFTATPLVLDVSLPDKPRVYLDAEYSEGTLKVATAPGAQITAFAEDGARQPANLQALRETSLRRAANGADLIVITTDQLAPALETYIAAREDQGLRVQLALVEDIYDEFGFGSPSPAGINAFLAYAHANWQSPSPRYVLLVGDATTDFRGDLAARADNPVEPPENIVPPFLVPVSFSGETVSDARLADIDGDLQPEMAIGRWPVDSQRAVRQLVDRTLAYEKSIAPSRAIFAADGTSDEFKIVTERLLRGSNFPAEEVEILHGPSSEQVAALWNQGAWLLTYTGHGSLELWGKDDVFSTASVPRLSQEAHAPIVLQLTCLSGLFAHPETTSLSEALLASEAGPVLTISATSLTLSSHQAPFATKLLEELQDPSVERVGDAFQNAKESLDVSTTGNLEISDTFGLLGDPAALIIRPQH